MATEAVIEPAAQAVTRMIDTRVVGAFSGGSMFGMALGFFYGYRFNRAKIRAEVLKEAEREIADIREVYRQKSASVQAQDKPSVEDVIRERGYSVRVEEDELHERPLPPPVVVKPAPRTRLTTTPPTEPPVRPTSRTRLTTTPPDDPPVQPGETTAKDKNIGWNFPREMSKRTHGRPYILHQDEYSKNESGFSQTAYLYYADDDVLVDEDGSVIQNPEIVVGPDALVSFGHGSDDFNTVYVRNSTLELEFEINKVSGSYVENVLGMEHESDSESDDASG